MPKRSNDFQRMVKSIHDAFSLGSEAVVTESAMLAEIDGTLREVDILVEHRISDVVVRLAIECRDRSRKSDIDWIDGLVGKFKNLSVDKIVAVSRRGFSKAAFSKAALNKIELRVLEECLEHEWKSEFMRLGVAVFKFIPQLKSVNITFEPPLIDSVFPETAAESSSLNSNLTLGQIVIACFHEHICPRVKRYVADEFLSKHPLLSELTRSWELTVPVDVNDIWITTENNSRHRLVAMKYEVVFESQADVSLVRHYQYGCVALASEAAVNVGGNSCLMRVVQVAGKNELAVNTSVAKAM